MQNHFCVIYVETKLQNSHSPYLSEHLMAVKEKVYDSNQPIETLKLSNDAYLLVLATTE